MRIKDKELTEGYATVLEAAKEVIKPSLTGEIYLINHLEKAGYNIHVGIVDGKNIYKCKKFQGKEVVVLDKTVNSLIRVVTYYGVKLTVPHWTNWLAIDSNGECYAFRSEPTSMGDQWVNENDNTDKVCSFKLNGHSWTVTKKYVGY